VSQRILGNLGNIVNLTKSDDSKFNQKCCILKHILNFIKDSNNTNIILPSVPHRHDLMDSSCVNNEIRTFNRKVVKL
jgi:hypothetical protein